MRCSVHCPKDAKGLAGSLAILVPVGYSVWRVLEWLQPAMVAAFWTGLAVAVTASALVVRHVMRFPLVNRFAYWQGSRADVLAAARQRAPELAAAERRALPGATVLQGVVLRGAQLEHEMPGVQFKDSAA